LDLKAHSERLKKVIEILKKGGIVALPTDTVFGFVTPYWSLEGLERIYKIKRRERKKRMGIFVAEKEDVSKFAKNLTETRKRLIYSLWPGEITFLFKAKKSVPEYLIHPVKKTISIRIPSHPLILRLCKEVGPLIQTSVNISGEKDIIEYKEVLKKFGNEIDYVYPQDAQNKMPSTILDLSRYPFKLLRKGPITLPQIENALLRKIKIDGKIKTNILFVCTGNTCRSPMAMGILYHLLPRKLREKINVKSAGTSAIDGFPISKETLFILEKDYRVNLTHLRTQSFKREHLDWADFIYVMERKHLREIQKMGYYEKTKLLCYQDKLKEIPDPFGKKISEYRKVSQIMERCIKKIVKDLKWRYDIR